MMITIMLLLKWITYLLLSVWTAGVILSPGLWRRWWWYLPAHIAVVLLRYPLAPIAVAFRNGYKLPRLFAWLDTIDNDLRGDEGWRTEHITGKPEDFWNMVGWVWRNGGNWFNYYKLGCAADDPHPFMRTRTDAMFGWNMAGPQHGRCKFCFTPRLTIPQ